MIAKVYVALLALHLALAPGCNSDGGDRKSPASAQPAPIQQAAAPNAVPSPAVPASPAAPAGSKSGACRLLTSEDIEAVQGEAVKEAKGGERADGPLLIGQCFYTTANFNKSVSLTLTQKNAASSEAGGPKEFWKRQFGAEKEREKKRREERERERDKDRGKSAEGEEKEHELPPQPVKGIGDEAYWVGDPKVGVLYVLKGNRYLRLSIGGPEEQRVKIEKMKELARRALKRL
jgi:hypothetical protein